ncbi:hypothetical protein LPB137_01160 [Poseidonibacter parvus]|uniref:Uncharacterized protein n=1 Tax=Poseidonibacter parvus TaxID=1850254 RepID=A0A1P8KJ13_9BACT|nr:hypothetical protein LPB137_01160 [Poseidonibacter parvus]
MILNLSKIKTESLLLFCKDLILSYKDKEEINITGTDKELIEKFNKISDVMLKEINKATLSSDYYMKNRKHYRVKAVLDGYNYINKQISKSLEKKRTFNPSMLYFSLLALWFKELNKESRSKEYIFFSLYTYGNVYDELLVKVKNSDFKRLNISMIEVAEELIYKLDSYSFK